MNTNTPVSPNINSPVNPNITSVNPNIVELNSENLSEVMGDESQKRLVLIDFWADDCVPCKVLMPVLEKLVNEYNGKFLLAKLNTEAEAEIAAQFGVQNIPTVAFYKDGQAIDGFQGVIPESEIRGLLEKHMPKPWDALMDQARRSVSEDKHADALAPLTQAYEESKQHIDVTFALAELYVHLKRIDEAEMLIKTIPENEQDESYEELVAQLKATLQTFETPEILALQKSILKEPDSLDLKFDLATQFNIVGKQKDAMELLIEVLRKDRDFKEGEAKKSLVAMIQALGVGDVLASEYQRKLFSLLH